MDRSDWIPDDLIAEIVAAAAEIDTSGKVPSELVARIIDIGLARAAVPTEYGGGERAPREIYEALTTLAMADGSTAWVAMVAATGGISAAYLSDQAAKIAFASPKAFVVGVLAPRGTATVHEDGFRIRGRWPYGSGIDHATHVVAGCMVQQGDTPRIGFVLVPVDHVEVHPTWDVSGLRGTGSHDFSLDDVVVEDWQMAFMAGAQPRIDRPLFRFPSFSLLALGVASVAIGIAQASIEELVRLAVAKVPTGSSRRLADRPLVQSTVSRSSAQLSAAAELMFGRVTAAYASSTDGPLSVDVRSGLRSAASHATETAAAVTTEMYRLGGGTSNYRSSALQRHLRDVHAATQHVMVSETMYEITGRLMLGIDTDTSVL